jgi:uncharacterized LabA/DUF88 family protein
MTFIDGENLAIRARKVAENRNITIQQSDHYEKDVFYWFGTNPLSFCTALNHPRLQQTCTRSYYYTSCTGDENRRLGYHESLWKLGFVPSVFHKPKADVKAKGVDIALTKDMLSHAFLNNYDAAVLIAGDGDYVPLVQEVQRLGKIVCVAAFAGDGGGLSEKLKMACDVLIPLDDLLS